MRLLAAVIVALVLALPGSAWAVPPHIAFLDLISGPATGNGDTSRGQTAKVNGTIVTLWGTNLGSSQGSSTITAGGVAPSAIYYWGNATPPACGPANLYNAYQKLQCVIFQIARTTPSGANNVVVTVGGQASAPTTFTVRPGTILFAATSGGDFTSMQAGLNWIDANSASGGDILYVKSGLSATGGVSLPHAKTNQVSVVTYPGAEVQVGDSTRDGFVLSFSGSGPRITYSKFKVYGGHTPALSQGVTLDSGARAVGNLIQAPLGDGSSGCLGLRGNAVAVLGNEFTACGNPASPNDLYHVIYVYGYRDQAPQRIEADRWLQWNYLHDNSAARGINVYNAEPNGNNPITGHRIDHNVIVAQRLAGIALLGGTVGENWVTANLLIHTGQGPGTAGNHVGIEINSYWPAGYTPDRPTLLHLWGNTLVNSGLTGAASNGALYFNVPSLIEWRGNIIYQGNGYPYLSSTSRVPTSNPGGYSNNLWYGAGAAPSWDTNSVNADPLFVSPSTGDYRLQAGSPARRAGSALGADMDSAGAAR